MAEASSLCADRVKSRFFALTDCQPQKSQSAAGKASLYLRLTRVMEGAGEARPLPEIDASRPRYAWLVEPSQLKAVQTTDVKVCLRVAFPHSICMRSDTNSGGRLGGSTLRFAFFSWFLCVERASEVHDKLRDCLARRFAVLVGIGPFWSQTACQEPNYISNDISTPANPHSSCCLIAFRSTSSQVCIHNHEE